MGLITVDYHDDLKEVQGDALLASGLSAPEAHAPFDRLAWWQNLCAEFDVLPLIVVARQDDAAVVMPLRRIGQRIEMLTCWYSFWARPVFVGRSGDGARLLHALARDLAGQAPHLCLATIPGEQGQLENLVAALRASGWATFVTPCDINHILPVARRSYAEYLASRPGPLRTTLKRKAGKVEVQLFKHFDADTWNAYEMIYARSWKPEEGRPAFLRRFAEEEGAAGRLRLGLALIDGVPVAAQFWTVEGGTAFIHKLAHDESAKAFSPGTVLTAALMEQVIDRDGVGLVDFGTGDDPYKRDWMDEVRLRWRIEAYRPLWPGTWPAIAKAWYRVLRARRLPQGSTLSRGRAT